jgi:hypothetical protein
MGVPRSKSGSNNQNVAIFKACSLMLGHFIQLVGCDGEFLIDRDWQSSSLLSPTTVIEENTSANYAPSLSPFYRGNSCQG